MSGTFQINIEATESEFKRLQNYLDLVPSVNSHPSDIHVIKLVTALKIGFLRSENKRGLVRLSSDVPNSIFYELEESLVYHIRKADVSDAEVGKIYLAAAHDNLLAEPEFKDYIEDAMSCGDEGVEYQARQNLMRPWERDEVKGDYELMLD